MSKLYIAKGCGSRWFPGIGRGRWDGLRNAFEINYKISRIKHHDFNGFWVGALLVGVTK